MTALPVIRDIWVPAQGLAPPVQRARSMALSPDFGALVGFREQHIGWMSDYFAYHDAIRRLEENDEGIVD